MKLKKMIGPAVMTLMVLAVVLYILMAGILPATNPAVSAPPPISGDDPVLQSTAPGYESLKPEVTTENVRQVLSDIPRPEHLQWEMTTTLVSGENTLIRKGICRYREDLFRVELYDESGGALLLCAGGPDGVTLRDERYSGFTQLAYADQTSPEALLGMAPLSFLTTADAGTVSDAKLVEYGDGWAVYAEFTFEELSQTERYWVSLEYGVVLKAETLHGGEVVYLAETTLIEKTESSADLFSLKG